MIKDSTAGVIAGSYFTALTKLLSSNQNIAVNIINSIPAGITITTDLTCKEIRHNRKAVEFLRIRPWDSFSHTVCEERSVKLIHNGKEITPAELPIQRACWNGEVVKDFELEFIWDDGVRKISVWNSSLLYDERGSIIGAVATFEDITKYKLAEEKNHLQKAVLDGINRIFHEALACETREELGKTCLQVAQELTQSMFGFIGEVDSAGDLDNIAISDPGWAACWMPSGSGRGQLPKDLEIHGVYGRVLREGKSIFTNEPAAHPDSVGLPEGHPLLHSFIGAPLIHSGGIIGMIGLGNREGGYSLQEVEILEALSEAIVQVLLKKRAEDARLEAGRLAEKRANELDAVIMSMPDGLTIYDKFGNRIFANDFSRNLCADRVRASETLTAEGKVLAFEELPVQRALKGEVVRDYELVFNSEAGECTYVSINCTPIRGSNGEITGAVATHRNITERKQAEEMLKLHQQQLEKLVRERTRELKEANLQITYILESIKDPFFTLDNQWRFIYVNHQAQEQFSYFGNLIGQNIWCKFPKMVGSIFWNKYHEVMNNNRPLVFEVKTSDTGLWSKVSVYPFGEGISVLFQDITERKLAEKNLRLSEERFCKIFQNSPDSIAIMRMRDNRYIDVNQKFLELTGYTRAEVLGGTPVKLRLWVENKHHTESLLKELSEKGEIHNVEYKIRTKSGNIVTVLLSAVIMDLSGEACRITLMRDMTKEKKMEVEMARLDRLHLVGEMAAGIGHEIRNPMTTVKGFLQLLSKKKELVKHIRHFNLMIEELDRVNSIITQFLSLAKNKVVDMKKENIKTIIETIFPLIQADAIKQDKNIETALDDVPEIILDEKEFRQLLLNLIRNGLEAMSPGGKITIKTFIENGEIVLAVQDEGKGISQEILDKIGTPFLTTKDNGTGLGLATCYSIANRHNAIIDIDTSPSGTTFFVRFKAS
ncbi:PAS domain S-box protein [Pelotomaculum terephthalicicum JT]|uniref:PAS domain S-box protein n=1 Tax=Pelotomaculum terephthalicicum TaxID=206393 RepID=UPI001F04F177|nr:PAS domain S-box protein [Pelotomaculum terephthalicicum]MCG9966668.1 PAS domain S-box protein [Pelotomaculum terephthalicicum JT]